MIKLNDQTQFTDAISERSPRVIDDVRARKLASDLKWCSYYETCATYGLNVERVFHDGKSLIRTSDFLILTNIRFQLVKRLYSTGWVDLNLHIRSHQLIQGPRRHKVLGWELPATMGLVALQMASPPPQAVQPAMQPWALPLPVTFPPRMGTSPFLTDIMPCQHPVTTYPSASVRIWWLRELFRTMLSGEPSPMGPHSRPLWLLLLRITTSPNLHRKLLQGIWIISIR